MFSLSQSVGIELTMIPRYPHRIGGCSTQELFKIYPGVHIANVRVTAWDILLVGHQRISGREWRGGYRVWRMYVGRDDCRGEVKSSGFLEVES